MFKKLVAFVIALTTVVGLAGCSSKSEAVALDEVTKRGFTNASILHSNVNGVVVAADYGKCRFEFTVNKQGHTVLRVESGSGKDPIVIHGPNAALLDAQQRDTFGLCGYTGTAKSGNPDSSGQ
ncbi:MAG: hypothetical protein Q4A34_02880 [Candidatus Saccharibacteria bacterium]|nr:hypothetical protein [Candidatus Saccharibacteria bacterium]